MPRPVVRVRHRLLPLLLGVAVAASVVLAPPPSAEAVDASSGPHDFVAVGDLVVFTATTGLEGWELWATDLETAWLVDDLAPGPVGSAPLELTRSGDHVYFAADTPATGAGLWRTDGAPGSAELVFDLPDEGGIEAMAPLGFDGDVVFAAYDPAAGTELWLHDASAGTTAIIDDLQPGMNGSDPRYLTPLGGRVFFSADAPAVGEELHVTDGSSISLVADLEAGGGNASPLNLTPFDDSHLVFSADLPGTGREPWITDGTPGGTTFLGDLNAGAGSSFPYAITPWQDGVVFTADDGVVGREPWFSDGTAVGTGLLHDVQPGVDGSHPDAYVPLGGQLLFDAETAATGHELWRTDGTPAGLEQVADLAPGAADAQVALTGEVLDGRALLFADVDGHGDELVWSDGTASGTEIVVEPLVGPQSSLSGRGSEVLVVGDRAVANLRDGYGAELWASGPGGTDWRRVADLLPGPGVGGREQDGGDVVVADDGRAFFTATHPLYGRELGVSDGTPAGTQILDLDPGLRSWDPRPVAAFLDGVLLEVRVDGLRQLGYSDGTVGGTVVLTSQVNEGRGAAPSAGVVAGDRYYFAAETAAEGRELWITDGTPAGTELVRDIAPGVDDGSPSNFAVLGDLVLFEADDGVSGRELWSSQGTSATTNLAVDIQPGAADGRPQYLTTVGDWVFFAADDGVAGRELWRTQGTLGTTSIVEDINPGAGSSQPNVLAAVGDRLFFAADDGATGQEPWVSDGLPAGTSLISDLEPGATGSSPRFFTGLGDDVVFRAGVTGLGQEPWWTDGVGVTLLEDLVPGPGHSSPSRFVAADGHVWFAARTQDGGVPEIIRTDGTVAGTVPSGLPGVDPDHLVAGSLWYAAHSEVTGRGELWHAGDPASGAATQVTSVPVVDRLAGDDRYATAVEVSRDRFATAATVVIARGDEYADALAGGPLAHHLGAPILLVRPGSLPDVTADEIDRLGATTAVILGGSGAVSDAVADELVDRTPVTSIDRVAGDDRFATAVQVAAELPTSSQAYVVEGINADPNRGWPDAVAVSSLASATGRPILLTRSDRLPDATAGYGSLGVDELTIVGGPAAVSEAVADALEAEGGTLAPRLSGPTRYETSLAVAAASVEAGLWEGRTWTATGLAFPDALVAGPAAASRSAVLLLVHGRSMAADSASADWYRDAAPVERAVLLGGAAAISEEVGDLVGDLVTP